MSSIMRMMKKNAKYAFLVTALLLLNPLSAVADSYNYNFYGKPIASPTAYVLEKEFDGQDLGVGTLNRPTDISISDQRILIADGGNNRVLVLSREWKLEADLHSFVMPGGETQSFNNPSGLAMAEDGTIFIADTGNHRIIVLNKDFSFRQEIREPALEGVEETFNFTPSRLDYSETVGKLYVVAPEMYDGILVFDITGRFEGFIGAQRISISAIDLFWRMLATRTQREKMKLTLPVRYNSLHVDDKGYLFACSEAEANSPSENRVVKLNPAGIDVMVRDGYVLPNGDVGVASPSKIVDIISRPNGLFSALDSMRNRVFTYDEEGNLLYVFGGEGSVRGSLSSAIALDALDDRIAVVDLQANKIVVFAPTDYANTIHRGLQSYQAADSSTSKEMWEMALKYNSSFDLSYKYLSKHAYQDGNVQLALSMAKKGRNLTEYSDAYEKYRNAWFSEYFGLLMAVLFVFVLVVFIKKHFFPAKVGADGKKITLLNQIGARFALVEKLRYTGYLLGHPLDGFWDLKHEKRGSLSAATVILVSACFTRVFASRYTGFLFRASDSGNVSLMFEAAKILVPFLLWCIVNWAVTTLVDGKGSFRDIYMATAYALAPVIIVYIPLTVVSNFMTLGEGTYYALFFNIALIWTVAMVLAGNMEIHDFSLSKTILTCVITIAGIGVVIYVGLLFFSFIDQIRVFIMEVIQEYVTRI